MSKNNTVAQNQILFFYETSHNEKKGIDISHLNIHQIYRLKAFFHFRSIKCEQTHQSYSSNGISLFKLYASVSSQASTVFQRK